MNKKRLFSKRENYTIIIAVILVVLIFFFVLYLLQNKNLTENEFGDYIGGILNPLFTLLSTTSIIILSLIIYRLETNRENESIRFQKRLTINQMRHESLNFLNDKMNLFLYKSDQYNLIKGGESKIEKKIYKRLIEEENKNRTTNQINIWLVILFEVEAFSKKNYLFKDLFNNSIYIDKNKELTESLEKLSNEQIEDGLVSIKSLSEFIALQQEFVSIIGNFILSEF